MTWSNIELYNWSRNDLLNVDQRFDRWAQFSHDWIWNDWEPTERWYKQIVNLKTLKILILFVKSLHFAYQMRSTTLRLMPVKLSVPQIQARDPPSAGQVFINQYQRNICDLLHNEWNLTLTGLTSYLYTFHVLCLSWLLAIQTATQPAKMANCRQPSCLPATTTNHK